MFLFSTLKKTVQASLQQTVRYTLIFPENINKNANGIDDKLAIP
jgi:hypothetical protein